MARFDDLTKLPSVEKAMTHLGLLSRRPITVRHMNEWVPTDPSDPPQLPSSAYVRMDDRDEVYINDVLPEHMLVHELIHPILWAEGYPEVVLAKQPAHRFSQSNEAFFLGHLDGIRDSLEHLEVHRRMREDYALDMAPYFRHKAEAHSRQLDEIVANVSRDIPFFIQKEIIDLLEMLEYRSYFGASLEAYRKVTPLAYSSAEQLLGQVRPVGFATPESAQRSYKTIRDFLVALGSRVQTSEAENDLWRALSFPLGSREASV